jgi:FOG: WD40 repeat
LTSFSPDSQYISAGSFTGDILNWSVLDGTIGTVINGYHKKPVLSVVWNPYECQVASIDSAGFIGLWN